MKLSHPPRTQANRLKNLSVSGAPSFDTVVLSKRWVAKNSLAAYNLQLAHACGDTLRVTLNVFEPRVCTSPCGDQLKRPPGDTSCYPNLHNV